MTTIDKPAFPCFTCKALCGSGSDRCTSCGAIFPWVAELQDLRNAMKESEPSRFRATAVLADELVRALRGEGRVSPSAMKGFLFAWLLPRVVVVIGSLLATIVLCVQTYIIWRQTELLQHQADAAQLERAEQLRLRIARTDVHVARLDLLHGVLVEAAYGPTPACDAKCQQVDFFTALTAAQLLSVRSSAHGMKEEGTRTKPLSAHDTALTQASEHVLYLRHRLGQVSQAISGGPMGTAAAHSAGSLVPNAGNQDVVTAGLDCAASSDSIKKVTAHMSLSQRLVPVLKGDTTGLEEPVTLMMLSGGRTLPHWTTLRTNGQYTVGALSKDLLNLLELLEEGVQDLHDLCAKKAAGDRTVLLRAAAS